MAFFAVLEPDAAANGNFTLDRCHVNVWSLPGFLGHRPMIFDVGLMFKAQTEELRCIELALPLRIAPHAADLSELLRDSRTAALIFGKSFERVNTRFLELWLDSEAENAERVTLVGLDERQTSLQPNDDELSIAKLALATRPPVNQPSYLRVRFVVDDAGTMWRWQRVLGRRNGLMIDFRAPDPREESRPERKVLEDRAKPMPELDVFFIVPERYQLKNANPELKYTRTLEGKVWDHYLRRSLHGLSAARRKHKRLMVHRWHPEEEGKAKAFDRDRPFRGFLQFTREPAFRAPSDLVLGSVLAALIFFALFRPLSVRSGVEDAGHSVVDGLGSLSGLAIGILAGATGLVLIGLVWKAIKNRKLPLTAAQKAKRAFKKVEYEWFKRM